MHANVTRMLEVQFVDEHGTHSEKCVVYSLSSRCIGNVLVHLLLYDGRGVFLMCS